MMQMNETAGQSAQPVIVKKYANRRLYNTESSSYITLDNLAEMVRKDRDFVVYDAKSGEDITRAVLTQIIVEEEGKGHAMLPTNFLRQLIGFYGGNVQNMVPRYLEQALSNFARQQETMRETMSKTLSPFMPPGIEDMSRKNLAMMERAMHLFTPTANPCPKARPPRNTKRKFSACAPRWNGCNNSLPRCAPRPRKRDDLSHREPRPGAAAFTGVSRLIRGLPDHFCLPSEVGFWSLGA
jgi:polyhydroxyalkanoate synthesis repressor PhaR